MVQARAFVCGVTPALGMRGATFLAFKTQNFFSPENFRKLENEIDKCTAEKKNRSQKQKFFFLKV
jgi:hypothetical protein